jgi:hypothetical protein
MAGGGSIFRSPVPSSPAMALSPTANTHSTAAISGFTIWLCQACVYSPER